MYAYVYVYNFQMRNIFKFSYNLGDFVGNLMAKWSRQNIYVCVCNV